MIRADYEKRAVEWLGTWVGDFDESVPYWQRRIEGLADDFEAVRAETLEAAAKECERRSQWAGAPELDFDRGYAQCAADCEAAIRALKEAT